MKLKRYRLAIALSLLLPMLLLLAAPALAATLPNLGTAATYGVLAGTTVTNTGPSRIRGGAGVSPGTAIVGFPPGTLTGSIHAGDPAAQQAQNDVASAYDGAAGQPCVTNLTGQNLGGQTLAPAVYCFNSSAQLTGQLILDGQGNSASVFIFQIGSTLTTASNANVLLINGAQACNILWQVSSSTTLGTNTNFRGNILALTSITLNTSASSDGGLYARNGAVTLDANTVQACTGPAPTNTPQPSMTNTLQPSATSTPQPSATIRPQPTRPLPGDTVVPSLTSQRPTDTAVPGLTDTPRSTNTAVSSATITPQQVATDTPVLSITDTPQPSATITPQQVTTDTPMPIATYTPEQVASNTPQPSATPSVPVPGLPQTGSGLPWASSLILLLALGLLALAVGFTLRGLPTKHA